MTPCTTGQVFHRRYRENRAKTVAKVYTEATDLLSAPYDILRLVEPVLADPFRAQNVTFVPSIFGLYEVSNGTGKANVPNRAGSASKGCRFKWFLQAGGRNSP